MLKLHFTQDCQKTKVKCKACSTVMLRADQGSHDCVNELLSVVKKLTDENSELRDK